MEQLISSRLLFIPVDFWLLDCDILKGPAFAEMHYAKTSVGLRAGVEGGIEK